MNFQSRSILGFVALLAASAGIAHAQPRIISLGQPVWPSGVSNGGASVIGSTNAGPKTWGIGASVAVGTVAPASSLMSTNALTPNGLFSVGNQPLPTSGYPLIIFSQNTVGARWSQATNSWLVMPNCGPDAAMNVASFGSSGDQSEATSPRGISANGRYIVGQAYVYGITDDGNMPTGDYSFRFRPWIWDTQTNTVKILPTPVGYENASTPAERHRDGRALCVSNDGSMVFGGWDPNVSGDGAGRMVIWYRDGSGNYAPRPNVNSNGSDPTWTNAPSLPEGTYDNGRDIDGFSMNADGTVIIGTSYDTFDINGNPILGEFPSNIRTFLTKWTRPNGSSQNWTRTKLYDLYSARESATPGTISSWWTPFNCAFDPDPPAIPDPQFIITSASDDGNTIVGILSYSTCGSFVRGGWIWKAGAGPGSGMHDLYDYLASQSTFDIANYGLPSGTTNEDHTGVQLGTPLAISADGAAIVGAAGPGSAMGPGWIVKLNGHNAVAPFVSAQPENAGAYSRCEEPRFNVAAGGSGVLSFQWYHGAPGSGTPVAMGEQASGSVANALTPSSLYIQYPSLGDAGNYYCIVSSSNGGSLTSSTVSATPLYASAIQGDLCATAQSILACANATDTTNELSYEACAAYVDEFRTGTGCYQYTTSSDAWFRYVPVVSGEVRIETCASTYFSSTVTAYDNCPQNGGTELACSTDDAGATPACFNGRIGRLAVQAGVPLWVRVANQFGPFTDYSTGRVKIYPAPTIPTNDGCASPATAHLGANAFDTSEATFDAGELIDGMVSCSFGQTRDVWFHFTAPSAGTLRASTCHNAADPSAPLNFPNTVLTAFNAQCGGTEIVCNDDALLTDCGGSGEGTVNTSAVMVGAVTAGQQIWFRVGGNASWDPSSAGAGVLTLSLTPAACNLADVAGLGGSIGPDQALTPDDLIVFLNAFFTGNLAIADIATLGGAPGHDGQLTPDDIVLFLGQFFSPCNP
ncbi:MAG: GC-type dockerin domain-anchored protein [Phycisphaerales bacterium]